jgi:hypothetical protein
MTAAEKLQLADDLCGRAVKRLAEGREICDCEVIQEALELANDAAALVSQVAAEAEKAGNMKLAQQACDMASNVVRAAVTFITETCIYCAQTSPDPETVACCEDSRAKAERVVRLNNQTIKTTFAAGAVPPPHRPPEPKFEPPVEDEPPIRDHEQPPASPV